MASKVKITVIKKMTTQDVFGQYPYQLTDGFVPVCERFNIGDEYIVSETGDCPDGFCGWAYADIQRDITHLRLGGNFSCMKDEGIGVSCCTDGLKPVFFKLERISSPS